MIIFLYGTETFRLRRKLKEIIAQYRAVHQSGLDFFSFKEFNFERFRNAIETASMFREKKLVVLENAFDQLSGELAIDYLKKQKIKEREDVALVLAEESEKLKKQNALFKFLTSKPSLSQEFSLLTGVKLLAWAKKEIKEKGGQIEEAALRRLISLTGNDIWRLDSELAKLLAYRGGQPARISDVDLLVRGQLDLQIFKTIDALADGDKKLATRLIQEHLRQGENELYLLSMIAYQFRNLLKIKDLLDKGGSPAVLAGVGLHPFVLRKTIGQAKRFSQDRLKAIFRHLLETEIKIKNGFCEPRLGIEMLVAQS